MYEILIKLYEKTQELVNDNKLLLAISKSSLSTNMELLAKEFQILLGGIKR